MLGTIGQYIKFADEGNDYPKEVVTGVFGPGFQTGAGWSRFLDQWIAGGDVDRLLGKPADEWRVQHFQALYIACWIFHPVEKGSFMLKLDAGQEYANVKGAYDGLLASGALQSRISSHLSLRGASAHEGWDFLRGYKELLVQMEGTASAPYLFLKCEGHPMDGAISTLKHGLSWGVKRITGSGKTASPELHNLAKTNAHDVELRAAENFGKTYEKLLKKLDLDSEQTTVAQTIARLWQLCRMPQPIPKQTLADNHALGNAMLGPSGLIQRMVRKQAALRDQNMAIRGLTFDISRFEEELTELAKRMRSTAVTHPQQHYHEVRMTPRELTDALTVFYGFIT